MSATLIVNRGSGLVNKALSYSLEIVSPFALLAYRDSPRPLFGVTVVP